MTTDRHAGLDQLYPNAASRWGGEVGLIGSTEAFTFADMADHARAVAGALQAEGLDRGDRVVVSAVKDAWTYLAIHGILAAGGVVVPVDPLAPADHAQRVAADAGAVTAFVDRHTLARHRLAESTPIATMFVFDADDVDRQADATIIEWREALALRPEPSLTPAELDDAAYLIYTSGSTGEPKGMVHTHRSAMAYVERAATYHRLGSDDRIAGMSPLHFDMSTVELYVAPFVGAVAVTMSEADMRMPASFTARAEQHRVTALYSVPTFLRAMVERGALGDRDLGAIRSIVYAGEPYPPGALGELMSAFPQAAVGNAYGPAETNVVTFHDVEAAPGPDDEVPIGKPWDDTLARVVDDDGTDVEPGTPGELWVSAPTVMAGYWRDGAVDSQILVVDGAEHPWYRTGDIVVADDDGTLHFRGRVDNQVKVRGVRIELEAVEEVLADAPGVAGAVVGVSSVDADEGASLVATVIVGEADDFDERALRRWCAQRLPLAAVPQHVAVVDALPTTPTGKVDRRRVRAAMAVHNEPEPAT